nr:hypothetical protein [uncultured Massilia sp.]
MAKPRRIKDVKPDRGQKIAAVAPVDYENNPPMFSLERIQAGEFCFSELSVDHKAAFGEAIYRRRSLAWKDINQAGRHGLGFEKIAKTSIRAPIPRFISDEFDHFLAFRFNGLRPMVGYRVRDVFYVLWFDSNFSLYDHD